ncbi:MAG: hypothetical protein LBN27_05365 [Prevotellaceae bacterium]|nr:hypothetical protein [Prevotellaceae bacterium]
MKKLFFLSLLALTFVATGCSKDGEKTYDVPTGNKTEIVGTSVVRTQVVNSGKEAVRVTYAFDGTAYAGQTWEFIFSTEGGALVGYAAYSAKYYNKPDEATVTVKANVVTIKYVLGKGIGDSKLQGLTSLDAIKSAAEILDILGLFNGGTN